MQLGIWLRIVKIQCKKIKIIMKRNIYAGIRKLVIDLLITIGYNIYMDKRLQTLNNSYIYYIYTLLIIFLNNRYRIIIKLGGIF